VFYFSIGFVVGAVLTEWWWVVHVRRWRDALNSARSVTAPDDAAIDEADGRMGL
jgi:hypothetical protein